MVRIKTDQGWREVFRDPFAMFILALLVGVAGLLITSIFFTESSDDGRNMRILAMLLVGAAQIMNLFSIKMRQKTNLYNENVETIELEYGIKFTDEQKRVKEKKG